MLEDAVKFLLEYVANKQPDASYALRASKILGALQDQAKPAPPEPVIPSAFKTVEGTAVKK